MTTPLEQAIDAQLLSGCRSMVCLAAIPPGVDGGKNDTNAIVQAEGFDVLAAIVNAAEPQTLSIGGWAEKLNKV